MNIPSDQSASGNKNIRPSKVPCMADPERRRLYIPATTPAYIGTAMTMPSGQRRADSGLLTARDPFCGGMALFSSNQTLFRFKTVMSFRDEQMIRKISTPSTECTKKRLDPFPDNRDIGRKTVVEPAIYCPIHPIIQYPLAGPEYPDIRCPIIVEVAYDGCIGGKTVVEPAIYGPIHPIIQYPLTGPEYPDIRCSIIVEVAYHGCIGGKTVVEPAIYGPIHPIIQDPLTGPEYPDIRCSIIVEVAYYGCIGRQDRS